MLMTKTSFTSQAKLKVIQKPVEQED